MKPFAKYSLVLSFWAVVSFMSALPVFAQAGGHASVGLGHGEEGYLHLQEMIKHLEFSMKMEDATPELKSHASTSLNHAKEALRHYNEALKHANESLGRSPRNPMMGEGSAPHSHDEGSQQENYPPKGGMEGSR